MYVGDFKSSLAKVRKQIHRIFPRELSPTRLLEQYQTKSARRAKAKIDATQAATADAELRAESLSSQLAAQQIALQSFAPGGAAGAPSPAGDSGARAGMDTAPGLPILLGGLAVVAGIIYIVGKKS